MMKKFLLIPILFAGLIQSSFAQEIITGLSENPVVKAEYERLLQSGQFSTRSVSEATIPLTLPFFDDFTQTWIYPDENRWMDKEVYVNSNIGYNSVNWGVATMDAIDSKGNLHSDASQFPFLADSLTSWPIRLDSVFSPSPRAITVGDSVYFSFYYQPQGRANAPEFVDSLILQFGYYTGDSVFAYTYDSIWVAASQYINENDTIFPGDTIYSPPGCQDIFFVSHHYYYYSDMILVPCDSVMKPEFKWQQVWSSEGLSLEDFYTQYGKWCRQVLIPITDSAKYFKSGFQFRFLNYASLSSDFNPSWKANCDQWNLDFIYLNINRKATDTVYRKVNFVDRAPSMLKNYQAMPYNQYVNDPTNEMKTELNMTITNLDSSIFNSTYFYRIYQVDGPFEFLYPGGNCNLFPYNLNGYQSCISCEAHACPPVNFLFPLSTKDSAEFEIRHYLIGDMTAQDTVADTISFRQKFFNYYAYDDGTPEAGYGLTPAGSRLAYRFKLNVKDTLRAVQMFFNKTQGDVNALPFDLMVWRDNNGKPGEVMYIQANQMVQYANSLLGFHTYMLDTPLLVNGVFYIGWQQLNDDNLNLGYDTYNDAQANIFYNSTGEWFNSSYHGSLMMRPMLGKSFELLGTEEHSKVEEGTIIPFPNPLGGSTIGFKCTGKYQDSRATENLTVTIYSMLGQRLYDGRFEPAIQPGQLAPGLYIVRIADFSGNIVSNTKLLKK
jgi:hypothetical protein